MSTLGDYDCPPGISNPSNSEISTAPFPICTYNSLEFPWRCLKKASQTIEDVGGSFYLFITKQINLLRLLKLSILPRELREFSRRATLPLTRPRNI